MELARFLEDIFFVVVIYKRKADQSPALNGLFAAAHQLSARLTIFVYDNNLEPSPPNRGVLYKHDSTNNGVSKAYNEASFLARKLKKNWMLLLDQDTELEPYALEKYFDGIGAYPHIKTFAPQMVDFKGTISPFRNVWGKGMRVFNIRRGLHSLHHLKIINSGMLINLDAFEIAGGFNESFPLDLSDFVFTDRLSKYYPEFVLIDCIITHNLSSEDRCSDFQSELMRFEKFIAAMQSYKKINEKYISITFPILARGLRLSIKHGNFIFFKHGVISLIKSA